MIHLKYDDFISLNKIPKLEKCIGVKGSNNFDFRIFSLPKIYEDIDLAESEFIFVLQILPVNKDESPYFQILEKTILENSIELKWTINNRNTSDTGTLKASIRVQGEENNIIWESNMLEFTVLDNIDAVEEISDVPPNIMEQYVFQAAEQANKSINAVNLIYEMYQDISNKYNEISELVGKTIIP